MTRRHEVGSWLLRSGYRFVPNIRQEPSFEVLVEDPRFPLPRELYMMRGVTSVFTFVKTKEFDPTEELKVQVIIATQTPMEIIVNFHSSKLLKS